MITVHMTRKQAQEAVTALRAAQVLSPELVPILEHLEEMIDIELDLAEAGNFPPGGGRYDEVA